MIDAASNFLTLRTDAVQLTLDVSRGERPAVLHWGSPLPGTDPAALKLLQTKQWAFGGAAEDLAPSLSNELGAGQPGPAGFLAHRAGEDWAVLFKTTNVDVRSETDAFVHCADDNAGISIRYHLQLHPETDMLVVQSEVTNRGDSALSLDWSTVVAMPLDSRLTEIIGFTGRWAGEFETHEVEIGRGSYLRENRAGRTSHDNFPGLIAKTPHTNELYGACAGFHLGWSANNRVRVDRHSDGRSYLQMGELFFPGEMALEPGTTYSSPKLFAAWSNAGLNGVSTAFHDHLSVAILDERTRGKPRPVHYNTWEAVYFDHSDDKLMKLADDAASVGAERFVLDDGWFGGRRGAYAGLGDWTVSKDVYPEGLHRLVQHVRDLGMEFGIWFAPEMVNPDSDLYRAHPDWVLSARGVEPIPFRNQLTLDFSKPEVADYLFDAISSIATEYAVDYIKWDMNRDTHHPGSNGGRAAMHQQTRAVYALIARLREAHPTLEIESCASGGARTDFGVLEHTDRLWTSDNNDALSRQAIQRGASYFFPMKVLGSHVGPKVCHITGRVFDMSFRVGTAIFGHMGMEVDLSTETEADLDILRSGIALYKEHRDLLHNGQFLRLEAPNYLNAVGVVAKDQSQALFSCAKIAEHGVTSPDRLRFAGLDADQQYRGKLVWPNALPSITVPSIVEAADLCGEGHLFSGEALMHFGMQLPLTHPNTCLIYHLQSLGDL